MSRARPMTDLLDALSALGCESPDAGLMVAGPASESVGATVVVVVPAASWARAADAAGHAGLDYLDMVCGVDASPDGIEVLAHLMDVDARPLRAVMLRTMLDADRPVIASISDIHPGAAWHEREVSEMLGVEFVGHPDPRRLLLSASAHDQALPGMDAAQPQHPLRKDVPLLARERPWPGAVEVTDEVSRRRRRGRQARPPGADTYERIPR